MTVKYVRICGRHRGPSSLCRHTAAKTIREKMTLLLHTAQSWFKMHPERGGNDFRARGCAPPQTFNDSFEFLVERPCVGARQTEDAPSTIGVGVCERGSMGGLNGSNVQNVRKYQNAAGCLGAQHRVWNIYVEFRLSFYIRKSKSAFEFDFFTIAFVNMMKWLL